MSADALTLLIIIPALLWLRSTSKSLARREVLEACQCLWCWWRSGVINGKVAVVPTSRVQIKAQVVATLLGGLWEDAELLGTLRST
jgi:hypothetical protein